MCKATKRTSVADLSLCTEATNMCRDNVGMFQFPFSSQLSHTFLQRDHTMSSAGAEAMISVTRLTTQPLQNTTSNTSTKLLY